jgi:ribonuclease P protein component
MFPASLEVDPTPPREAPRAAAYTASFPPWVVSDETHLPAKETQACADPRVPDPHAHPRGPLDPQATARKGTQAPDGLMLVAAGSEPRRGRGRLSRSADFDRVFRQGRSHAGRDLVLYVFPRGSEDREPRLGLSVSRKVGGAVERNRVKRLLREAFASAGARLPPGTDAVIIARHGVRELAERDGLRGVHGALSELIDRVAGATPRPGEDPAPEPRHAPVEMTA